MIQSEFKHNMIKEILEEPSALQRTYSENRALIKSVSENILSKYRGNLYVTGSGTSFHASLSFQYSLFQMAGVYTTVMFASEFPTWISDHIQPTVLIAVSQSGESSDIVKAVKWASELGFHKVAITNRIGSQLAKLSDDVLYTYAGEEASLAATKTYVTQLLVLLMLSTTLSHLMGKVQDSPYHTLMNDLKDAGVFVEKAVDDNLCKIEAFVGRIGNINRAFVLGSGALYPSAIEGALKIKETCTIPSEGFALREFLHGPIQLAGKESLTLVLGHSRLDETLYLDVINKVKNFGGKVLLVSDRSVDAEVDEQININVPYMVSPVVFAPVFQILSYYMALSKGLNPDTPEKLSKVVR
ncbi:MAG: SIS domain-containing protein [Nitrososphaeria archaeon]